MPNFIVIFNTTSAEIMQPNKRFFRSSEYLLKARFMSLTGDELSAVISLRQVAYSYVIM